MIVIDDKIKELLEEKYKEEAFADCFTVEIMQNNSKLQVFIDSDTSMSLGRCQKISRYLEAVIDEEGWLGEKYILEVSSPGATRPLIERQYHKHIGRKVKVKLGEKEEEGILKSEKVEGVLEAVESDKIIVAYQTIERIKKKKIKTDVKREIDFGDIKEIKVKISF